MELRRAAWIEYRLLRLARRSSPEGAGYCTDLSRLAQQVRRWLPTLDEQELLAALARLARNELQLQIWNETERRFCECPAAGQTAAEGLGRGAFRLVPTAFTEAAWQELGTLFAEAGAAPEPLPWRQR